MHFIGLDLGGTKLASALMDGDGTLIRQETTPLEDRKGEEVSRLIISQLNHLRSERPEIKALGVSVPGIYHPDTGRVWAPNIPGWDDYPLFDELKASLDGTGIKVAIDSDRACYILGEVWKGVATECRNAVFLAVGTGIGAGILLDGKIARGSHDIAGAVGWMSLMQPFRQDYSKYGCFEYHASGDGLARMYREYAQEAGEKPHPGLTGAGDRITSRDVFEAYDRGDPVARRVISESIELWGAAAANIISLLNPEKVIFGGGVFGPATRFLDDIRKAAGKWSQPISFGKASIEVSRLEGKAGLYGTGKLAQMAL